jgi:hypothetical protein
MADWIDVNLPWSVEVEHETAPYPEEAVDKAVFAEFGFTKEQLYGEFKVKHGVEAWLARYDCEEPERKEADELFEKVESINKFVETADIPELDVWVAESARIHAEEKAERKRTSFRHSDLNRPGVLIEVQHNNKRSIFLLGNINCNAGICNDCTAFDDDAIVLRAKVLIQEDEMR